MATDEKLWKRTRAYAARFVNESDGYPTDAEMTRAFAHCARVPPPEWYDAIRAHVSELRRERQDTEV